MIADTVRAARIDGPERLAVRSVTLPSPAADEVVVSVEACGICGSNLHEWRQPEQRLTDTSEGATLGATGHEVAVRVLSAPEGSTWASGDRAVLEPNLVSSCGGCSACREGSAWFCRTRRPVATWGFATRMLVPEASLFRIPETLGDAPATLVEPTACVVHALRQSWTADRGRLDGRRIAILGAGVTGLLAVAVARHLGADHVAISARHPHQALAAERLGADVVLDAAADDLVAQIRQQEPDLVLEVVGGRAPTFELACRTVRPRGEVVVLGLFDDPPALDARRAVFKELRMFFPVTYGVSEGSHDFEVAIEVIAGLGELAEGLVTHRYGLDDIDAAFTTAAEKREGALRVIVTPQQAGSGTGRSA